jgi:predicted metal-dependent hydrolase
MNAVPLSPATRSALSEGARRFDQGRWFEAHEVWEDVWLAERGAVRQLLQGLIQVAAGFHKGLVQGRPTGMVRLLGAGLSRLATSGDLGLLDLDGFTADVSRWREAAQRWVERGERPDLPPPKLGARLASPDA